MDLPRIAPITLPLAMRRLLWRLRRPVAALCAGLAAVAAVQALRSPGPPTSTVMVAARDLDAGSMLDDADLAPREYPTALLPAGVTATTDDLSGRRVAVDIPAGLPLVTGQLTSPSATGPPGTVVVPIRFADDALSVVLAPGRRIDVVAIAAGQEPRTVARAALVLSTWEDEVDSGGLLGGTDSTGPVLLAVDPDEAVQLSAASASSGLTAILVE